MNRLPKEYFQSTSVGLFSGLPASWILSILPRKAQFLGESAENNEHDGGSGYPTSQTNRTEISFKDKKITIFARCRRTEGSKCQPVGKATKHPPLRCGDELHHVSGARPSYMCFFQEEENSENPSKIVMHNSNLMYSIYPVKVEEQDVLDTFFANSLWKDHKIHKGDKNFSFIVDEVMPFKICLKGAKIKNNPNATYALHKAEIGRGNQIPLWMFGFLY